MFFTLCYTQCGLNINELKINKMTNEQTAFLNYATTLSKIITHTNESENFTPISEEEFKKLEKKTQSALTKYAKLKGAKFDKYVEKPKMEKYI